MPAAECGGLPAYFESNAEQLMAVHFGSPNDRRIRTEPDSLAEIVGIVVVQWPRGW